MLSFAAEKQRKNKQKLKTIYNRALNRKLS